MMYQYVYKDVIWILDTEGNLEIYGQGEMFETPGGNQLLMATEAKTAKVRVTGATNAEGLFQNFTNLVSVDFSESDTSLMTNMGNMFDGCSSLETLDLSSFDLSNLNVIPALYGESEVNIFQNCSSLSSLKTPKATKEYIIPLEANYQDSARTTYTSIPKNIVESIVLTRQ